MITATGLHVFMPVLVTLTLFQGYRRSYIFLSECESSEQMHFCLCKRRAAQFRIGSMAAVTGKIEHQAHGMYECAAVAWIASWSRNKIVCCHHALHHCCSAGVKSDIGIFCVPNFCSFDIHTAAPLLIWTCGLINANICTYIWMHVPFKKKICIYVLWGLAVCFFKHGAICRRRGG